MDTTEKELKKTFEEFGEIEKIDLIYDRSTGQSRGFGFIYFERLGDASTAREKLNGIDLDGRTIRIDYSLTKKAHSPTPGNYQGGMNGGRGGGKTLFFLHFFKYFFFVILCPVETPFNIHFSVHV